MNQRISSTSAHKVVRRVLLQISGECCTTLESKEHEIMHSTWCASAALTPQVNEVSEERQKENGRLSETHDILQGLTQRDEPRTQGQHLEMNCKLRCEYHDIIIELIYVGYFSFVLKLTCIPLSAELKFKWLLYWQPLTATANF